MVASRSSATGSHGREHGVRRRRSGRGATRSRAREHCTVHPSRAAVPLLLASKQQRAEAVRTADRCYRVAWKGAATALLLLLPHCDSAVAQLRPSRRAAPNRPTRQRGGRRRGRPQTAPFVAKQWSRPALPLVVRGGRVRCVDVTLAFGAQSGRTPERASRAPGAGLVGAPVRHPARPVLPFAGLNPRRSDARSRPPRHGWDVELVEDVRDVDADGLDAGVRRWVETWSSLRRTQRSAARLRCPSGSSTKGSDATQRSRLWELARSPGKSGRAHRCR